MAAASTFPVWGKRVARWLRQSVVHLAAAGLFVGFFAGVVYVLGPYLLPHYSSADEIASAVARAISQQGAIPGSAPNSPPPKSIQPEYLRAVSFVVASDRPLWITATANVTTSKLSIYVDASSYFLGRWSEKRRIAAGDLSNVIKDTPIDQTIVFRKGPYDDYEYWIGPPGQGFIAKDIIKPGNAIVFYLRVIVIGPNGEEQRLADQIVFVPSRNNQDPYSIPEGSPDWAKQ
jgi:hypothetical protein